MHTLTKLVLVFLVLWGTSQVLVWIVNRTVKDLRNRHLLRKAIAYTALAFFLVTAGKMILPRLNVSLVLGITSAGIALALQEAVLSIAGWLFILIKKPYALGDRIEINGVKGDVIDIRTFQTTLLEVGNWVGAEQSTGRIVHIPNSFVFKYPCYNYTRGFEFIWNELSVVITFDSDWERAKEILLELGNRWAQDRESIVAEKVRRMADNYMIHFNKFTPIVYVSIVDSGVKLTLRYMIEAKQRRSTTSHIFEDFLRAIEEEPRVNLAYTTYTVHLQNAEQKKAELDQG